MCLPHAALSEHIFGIDDDNNGRVQATSYNPVLLIHGLEMQASGRWNAVPPQE